MEMGRSISSRFFCYKKADGLYSAGGIKLVNGSRRITIDNTLDERLRLLEDRVRFICLLFYDILKMW